MTATGSGFSATYGRQVVQFYDVNADLMDEQYATTISSTQLTFPYPGLTGNDNGTIARYLGVILNKAANGGFYAVNTGNLEWYLLA